MWIWQVLAHFEQNIPPPISQLPLSLSAQTKILEAQYINQEQFAMSWSAKSRRSCGLHAIFAWAPP
jgi:hypothetical protein